MRRWGKWGVGGGDRCWGWGKKMRSGIGGAMGKKGGGGNRCGVWDGGC